MTIIRKAIIIASLAAMLGGCNAINSLTGSVDNTVLPGQREEAIPGRSQFPEGDSSATASTSQPGPVQQAPPDAAEPVCADSDPDCAPPTGDDTFSDPQ